MNIILPLNKRLIVEPEPREKVSQGGIIIPEIANQKTPTKGKVMSIAEDSDINKKIKPGDDILFSKFAGTEILLRNSNGEDRHVIVLKDEDVLAIIKKKA